jgi:peptidoglycan/xylan/chitin deacetylase (PgdA/CDA1 family)
MVRGHPRDGRSPVVNLCFHGIGTPGRELEPNEHLCWVTVEQFEEMLAVVAAYPSLRLTFDDGNASDVAVALPALLRGGLRGEFFVLAGRLGQPGSLDTDDVRTLAEAGMIVGSHGMRHRAWRLLDTPALEDEMVTAAAVLAEATGRPVRHAACPFGAYDRTVLRELRRRGYTRVYTVDGGPARPDRWLQSRYVIGCTDTPRMLERLAQDPDGGRGRATVRAAKSAIKRWR